MNTRKPKWKWFRYYCPDCEHKLHKNTIKGFQYYVNKIIYTCSCGYHYEYLDDYGGW